MYNVSKEEISVLNGLEADFRFVSCTGGQFKVWNQDTKQTELVDATKKNVCIITDRQTGVDYGFGIDLSEEQAFKSAIKNAIVAPKPMTKAQQFAVAGEALLNKNTSLEAENASLKARLSALEAASIPKASPEERGSTETRRGGQTR